MYKHNRVFSVLTTLGVFIGALAPSSIPVLAEENNIIEPTEISSV